MHSQSPNDKVYKATILDQTYSELPTPERRDTYISALQQSDELFNILMTLAQIDSEGFQQLKTDLETQGKNELLQQVNFVIEIEAERLANEQNTQAKPTSTAVVTQFVDPQQWEKNLKQAPTKKSNEEILQAIKDLLDDSILFEPIDSKIACVTPQGTTYELAENGILAYIKKEKKDPINGTPLSTKDLRPNKLFKEIQEYFSQEDIDITVYSPCLICKETGMLYQLPVVNTKGETKEFSQLKKKEQDTFKTDSKEKNKDILYQNRIVSDLINLIKEARLNNNLPAVPTITTSSPHILFNQTLNNTNAQPKDFIPRFEVTAEELDLTTKMNNLMTMLTKEDFEKNKAEFNACSLLVDALRGKISASEIFDNESLLEILAEGKLKDFSKLILNHLYKRDIEPQLNTTTLRS